MNSYCQVVLYRGRAPCISVLKPAKTPSNCAAPLYSAGYPAVNDVPSNALGWDLFATRLAHFNSQDLEAHRPKNPPTIDHQSPSKSRDSGQFSNNREYPHTITTALRKELTMSSTSAQPSSGPSQAHDQDTEMLDPPPPPPAPQPSSEEQRDDEDTQAPSQPQQPSTQNPPQQPQQEQPQEPPIPTPGPRAARLQALFASTARHTLDKISKENFGACFPTMSARAPGTLEFVQRQMVDRLGGLWNVSFSFIYSPFFIVIFSVIFWVLMFCCWGVVALFTLCWGVCLDCGAALESVKCLGSQQVAF